MSLVLNEEQMMLQASAAEFFASELPTTEFRRQRDTSGYASLAETHWQKMVDLGWCGSLLPESLGGLDFGITGMGLLCEQAGKTLAATPLPSLAVAVDALLGCEASAERDALLQHLAAGEKRVSVHLGAQFEGGLASVAEGLSADVLLIVPDEGGAIQLYDLHTSRVSRQRVNLIDGREYAIIELNGAIADQEFEVMRDRAHAAADIAAVLAACEMWGCAQAAFEMTLTHLREREQFNQKLGEFQALQHRMAQSYMKLEMLKSVIYDALAAIDGQRQNAALAVSHAKVMANDCALLVCQEAIQLHGGMGITDELDVGLFYKRVRVLRTAFGGSAEHRQRFASLSGW